MLGPRTGCSTPVAGEMDHVDARRYARIRRRHLGVLDGVLVGEVTGHRSPVTGHRSPVTESRVAICLTSGNVSDRTKGPHASGAVDPDVPGRVGQQTYAAHRIRGLHTQSEDAQAGSSTSRKIEARYNTRNNPDGVIFANARGRLESNQRSVYQRCELLTALDLFVERALLGGFGQVIVRGPNIASTSETVRSVELPARLDLSFKIPKIGSQA